MTVQKSRRVALGFVVCSLVFHQAHSSLGAAQATPAVQRTFPIKAGELATEGENAFFVLKPGYQLTLGHPDARRDESLVITVLNETKNVGGIETRIVEERESKGGELVEVSRNYFAISTQSGDVYYLGEDVDMYKKGKVVSHEGAWHHGERGATFGLAMPGKPSVGLRYYQELAKGVAMDRGEIVSVMEQLTTPAGSFERVLKIKETTPLEPLAREYKLYAPGIGLIKDGDLVLVSRRYLGT